MSEMFDPYEATIAEIHEAFAVGAVTCLQLTEWYLKRIESIDRDGPALNSVISVSTTAREDAAALDRAYAEHGPVGPLHGIPVMVKDQIDVAGLPTTLGSTLLKDFFPDRDGVIVEKLKAAGALILGKTTLGEFAGGDTHGSLFGSTGNPYDPERTAGGSSGGSAVAVSANLGAVAIAQEEFASIRRPAAWNGVVGMRPSLGVVSRSGAYRPWPFKNGSLGPMSRTVADTARVMDAIAGFDSEDPATVAGIGRIRGTFVDALDDTALAGARIGVIRESIGIGAEPGTRDFEAVRGVFTAAVDEISAAGAEVVDDIRIPRLDELLALRYSDENPEAFENWMRRNANPPFATYEAFAETPQWRAAMEFRARSSRFSFTGTREQYLVAREELLTNVLHLMAEKGLDAIAHVTVEHTATLIADGVTPPYVNMKGAPHLNTFLYEVPAITVPAGHTGDGLPVGLTLMGRPFADREIVGLAHAFERATRHRVAPPFAPRLVSVSAQRSGEGLVPTA